MGTSQPISYIIPSFPKKARFIRIEGNFDHYFSVQFESMSKAIIESHRGPIRLITVKGFKDIKYYQNSAGLKRYGLKASARVMNTIKTTAFDFILYQVEKI